MKEFHQSVLASSGLHHELAGVSPGQFNDMQWISTNLCWIIFQICRFLRFGRKPGRCLTLPPRFLV
jgi:hypothetical protein